MNVGILTMCRLANYGSYWQARCLGRMMERLGTQVSYLSYSVPSEGRARKVKRFWQVAFSPFSLRDKIRFLLFKATFLRKYSGEFKETGRQPDLLIVGSDEVFNVTQENKIAASREDYFGMNATANRKISFAASFGQTTLRKLRGNNLSEAISDCLSSFDRLSVRDENSAQIVRELLGQSPPVLPDPVLCADWSGYACPSGVPREPYCLLYGYAGRFSEDECRGICEFAQALGGDIITIGGAQRIGRFLPVSVEEAPRIFAQALAVVTDTFHGCVFSMVFRKEFAAYARKALPGQAGNEEKVGDLLSRYALEDRLCASAQVSEIFSHKTDYSVLEEKLPEDQKAAWDFLREAVETWEESSREEREILEWSGGGETDPGRGLRVRDRTRLQSREIPQAVRGQREEADLRKPGDRFDRRRVCGRFGQDLR